MIFGKRWATVVVDIDDETENREAAKTKQTMSCLPKGIFQSKAMGGPRPLEQCEILFGTMQALVKE